jgi:hypothetical protein
LLTRVARFFYIGTTYQNVENIPKYHKTYQIINNTPNYHKIYQMAKIIPNLSTPRPPKICPNIKIMIIGRKIYHLAGTYGASSPNDVLPNDGFT